MTEYGVYTTIEAMFAVMEYSNYNYNYMDVELRYIEYDNVYRLEYVVKFRTDEDRINRIADHFGDEDI